MHVQVGSVGLAVGRLTRTIPRARWSSFNMNPFFVVQFSLSISCIASIYGFSFYGTTPRPIPTKPHLRLLFLYKEPPLLFV